VSWCAVLPAVAGRINHGNYKSWEYEDAHLTEFGWKQAKAVQEHIRAHSIKVDVVVVSPLTRALETAVGCFGNFAPPLNGTPPLMMGLTEQAGVRPAHPAVGSEGCPPFVCYELCREHLGVHPCDRRHPIAAKQAMFPGVCGSTGCVRLAGMCCAATLTCPSFCPPPAIDSAAQLDTAAMCEWLS
jgi:hypothetical protein